MFTLIDPGLMELGGHHAAFVQTLVDQDLLRSARILCHKSVDSRLSQKITSSEGEIVPCFTSNFYEHFEAFYSDEGSLKKTFIRKLAAEYFNALKNSLPNAPIILPCLSWQHLEAVALAALCSRSVLNIKACLMFNPGINHRGEVISSYRAQNYYRAVGLANQARIKLYVSDLELQVAFSQLTDSKLPVHPCYLANWSSLPAPEPQEDKHLLYFGDAKVDKGFLKLPSISEKLLSQGNANTEIIVQYTLNWDMPELDPTRDLLTKLAEKDSRLKIVTEFWSNEELAKTLATSRYVYRLYETKSYLHKSSGLDWWTLFYSHLDILPSRHRSLPEKYIEQRRQLYFRNLSEWIFN